MSLRFFKNNVQNNLIPSPPTLYEDLQQEFINLEWDNTAVIRKVEEQAAIGSDIYNEIEVWVDATIADTTTGLKDTFDFLKFIFKDITHQVKRGQMYKFDNNYWIVHSYTPYDGLAQSCGVRRCNNFLRIVDPLNGGIVSFPCIIDYDMSSPSAQTSRYIITPNNHAVVMVQGNELSHRLLKTNSRFILGGRPFKLLAYQNAIEDDIDTPDNTLMYLDLYLDEIHDKDDIINKIAENGVYDYDITVNTENMDLLESSQGNIQAFVLLNNELVERELIWESKNENVIIIDNNGNYIVKGFNGEETDIQVSLKGNKDIYKIVHIIITDTITPSLIIDPIFNIIKQYEEITFTVKVEYGGTIYSEFDSINVSLSSTSNDYCSLVDNFDGSYTLIGEKISSKSLSLNISVLNSSPEFNLNNILYFNIVSMIG